MRGAYADDFPCGTGDLGTDAFFLKLSNRRPGAEELAGEIDIDHFTPLVERHLIDRRISLQTCVIYKNVDGAEPIDVIVSKSNKVLPSLIDFEARIKEWL